MSKPNKSKNNKQKKQHHKQAESAGGSAPKKLPSSSTISTTTSQKSTATSSSSTLQQQLKKHRGTAASTPAPPPFQWKIASTEQPYSNPHSSIFSNNFLSPHNDSKAFDQCVKTSYAGFYYDEPNSLPGSLHRDFEVSFEGMENGGLFLYDTVQPGKKRLTRTSVTRTLVGDPGSTYKYLGLRLFSHPWLDIDSTNGNPILKSNNIINQPIGHTLKSLGYSTQTTSALITMGRINADLTKRSKSMLQTHISPKVQPVGLVGSADFNLTLVNRMESTAEKRDLKMEMAYGMGKISVGWHRDSGLKDFSSIAVYQSLKGSSSGSTSTTASKKKKKRIQQQQQHQQSREDWGVALRAMDGGTGGALTTIPPLLVPLPSGTLYYMLDDFNHNHEHAVIAGANGIRYSSTHRVAREGAGTWQYIRDKVDAFFDTSTKYDLTRGIVMGKGDAPAKKAKEKLVTHVRALQNLMTEIEFEWIRQWYVQGKKHADLHPYWHKPMESLCESLCKLEKMTTEVIGFLQHVSDDSTNISEDLFDVLIELIVERSRQRGIWNERYQDPIFRDLPEDERPFSCPCLDREGEEEAANDLNWDTGRMPENLNRAIEKLREYRAAYVGGDAPIESSGDLKSAKSKKRKASSMTKKEQKRVASNWERLKSKIGS